MNTSYKYTDESKQHLHSLNGKPLYGTSTISKVIGKGDALTWWASGMACAEFGWLNPKKHSADDVATSAYAAYQKVKGLSFEDYRALLANAYKAFNTKKNESAKTGTDMHAELEKYVKGCIEYHNRQPKLYLDAEYTHKAVREFAEWAVANVEIFLWSEAHCYSETLWVGGISDCGALLKDKKVALIDFKSSKEAYFEQFVQAGGYALQIDENGLFDADGKHQADVAEIGALIIVPFGAEEVVPKVVYAVDEYKNNFKSALTIYKSQQAYVG